MVPKTVMFWMRLITMCVCPIASYSKGGLALIYLLLLLGICGMSDSFARGQESSLPTTLSAKQVIEGLVAAYSALGRLPGLEVEYRIDRKSRQAGSAQVWRWEWCETLNLIKPSDPGKVYSRFRAPTKLADRNELVTRISSSDLEVQCLYEVSENGLSWAGITSEAKEPGAMASLAVQYFEFLGVPIARDPEIGVGKRRLYPQTSYWLPEALKENSQHYTLRPHLEKIDGVRCHVLERTNMDILWVQTSPDFILKRRRFYWTEGNLIRQEATFENQILIKPGLWLPRRIVFDYYGAPWDKPEFHGKIASRLVLEVSRLSSREVSDREFRVVIAPGTLVLTQDGHRFVHEPGTDPYKKALDQLLSITPWYRKRFLLLWLLCAFTLFGWVVWRILQHLRRGTTTDKAA